MVIATCVHIKLDTPAIEKNINQISHKEQIAKLITKTNSQIQIHKLIKNDYLIVRSYII